MKATPSASSRKVSTGGVVGIIIAVIALVIVAAATAFYAVRHNCRKKGRAANKGQEIHPFEKSEMDGNGKPAVGELDSDHKFDQSAGFKAGEMEGSKVDVSAYGSDTNIGTGLEGSKVAEMEGTWGGVEMEGSTGGAEMEADTIAPIEMYAGPHGLYDSSTPLKDRSELPSPHRGNRNRKSRMLSWGRRQSLPRRLSDSEGGEMSSPDTDRFGSRNAGEIWSGRRRRRRGTSKDRMLINLSSQTEGSKDQIEMKRPMQSMSRNNTRVDVPDIQGKRERGRGRYDSGSISPSTTPLEVPSRRATTLDVPSPIDGSRNKCLNEAESRTRLDGSTPRSSTPRNDPSPITPGDDSRGRRERFRGTPTSGASRFGTPREHTPSGGSPRRQGNFF